MLLERIAETIEQFFKDLLHEQRRINEEILHDTKRGNVKIMAAIDDLKTELASLKDDVAAAKTSLSAELNVIATKLAAIPTDGGDLASVIETTKAIHADVLTFKEALDNETAVLTAPVPPVPPVTPAA